MYGDDNIDTANEERSCSKQHNRTYGLDIYSMHYYQEMKKILLFWQFSSVVKSKSKTA